MAYKNQKKNKLNADLKRRENKHVKIVRKRERKISELVKSGVPKAFAKLMTR